MDKSITGIRRLTLNGSHIPILVKLIEMTDGPILELGMGQFSTALFDMMCMIKKRRIVSYENNELYFKMNRGFMSSYHEVNFIQDWEKADIDKTHWDIALMDHAPEGRRRFDAIRLRNNVNYMVLHDSDESRRRFYKYDRVYPYFKYRFDYTECTPSTTVLSNFRDLGGLARS